jgi:NifU-like protein involved in Fe-S cluster formation
MTDELYHQAILELAKQAGRTPRLEAPDASVTVDNPLCGDRITLDLRLADGRVGAVGHKVRGCLLCQAAAAVIAARAPGETPAALHETAGRLGLAIRKNPAEADGLWPELAAFAPVHAHKSRHDCVLLPFEALTQALAEVKTDGS